MIKHILHRLRINQRGQSFVELMLVTLILALMLSGVVEFGLLLNNYLKVLDSGREAARFSSTSWAFDKQGIDIEAFYTITAIQAMRVMSPVVLNGNRGDDIIISVFGVDGGNIWRWPSGQANGWSLCSHYSDPIFHDP